MFTRVPRFWPMATWYILYANNGISSGITISRMIIQCEIKRDTKPMNGIEWWLNTNLFSGMWRDLLAYVVNNPPKITDQYGQCLIRAMLPIPWPSLVSRDPRSIGSKHTLQSPIDLARARCKEISLFSALPNSSDGHSSMFFSHRLVGKKMLTSKPPLKRRSTSPPSPSYFLVTWCFGPLSSRSIPLGQGSCCDLGSHHPVFATTRNPRRFRWTLGPGSGRALRRIWRIIWKCTVYRV